MRKGFHGVLIACAIFFSVGVVLCIVGFAAGGELKDMSLRKEYNGEVEALNQTLTEPINSLDISIRSGKFTIESGDQFKIEGSNIPKDSIKYYVENGVLVIDDELERSKDHVHLGFFNINIGGVNSDKKITLTIPKDTTFDSVKFDMAAGKSSITDLTTKSGEFVMAAGKLEAKNLTTLDSTRLNMDAGSLEITKSNIRNSEIEVNAGSLEFDGKVLGKTRAEVNAGRMKVDTELEESEYLFRTDSSFGNVKINGDSEKGMSGNINSENEMDLECNAGSIEVKTK